MTEEATAEAPEAASLDAPAYADKCGSCRFSDRIEPLKLNSMLHCRRFPPQISPLVKAVQIGGMVQQKIEPWCAFPVVAPGTPACGEFQARKPAKN